MLHSESLFELAFTFVCVCVCVCRFIDTTTVPIDSYLVVAGAWCFYRARGARGARRARTRTCTRARARGRRVFHAGPRIAFGLRAY